MGFFDWLFGKSDSSAKSGSPATKKSPGALNSSAQSKPGIASRPAAPAPASPRAAKPESGINACDEKGRTRLMLAAYNDQPELVQDLIAKGADINKQDSDGRNALHYAFADHSFGPANILIEAGIDLKQIDKAGRNILFFALEKLGNPEFIETMLIQKGAEVNAADAEGLSPLGFILSMINEDRKSAHLQLPKVKMLLANKADPNARDLAGVSCFMRAVAFGLPDFVEVLLQYKADVRLADKAGNSPLINAVKMHGETGIEIYLTIVQILLTNHADPKQANLNGKTALDVAEQYGNPAMISVLQATGALDGKSINPSNQAQPQAEEDEAADANNRACLLERSGNLADALKIYDQLIVKFPNYKKAWRNKGMILAGQGKLPEALRCVQRAIEIDCAYVPALIGAGLVSGMMKEYQKAVSYYDSVLKIDPYNTDALFNKGDTLAQASMLPEAVAAFSTLLKINPNDAEAAERLEQLKAREK